MLDAVLTRFESSDQGTFGRISVASLALFTGELPWRDNASSISCVPSGSYRAILTYSPRFGRALYLLDRVPNRSGIRIHPANFMGDSAKGWRCQLNGCIALGERLGWMDGQKSVMLSSPAVRRLGAACGGAAFRLNIREQYA